MKLVHKSGSLRCNPIDPDSYWGCTFRRYNNSLMTLITNEKGEAILPSTADMEEAFTTGHECTESISIILMVLITKHQSWFFATFQTRCLSHVAKSCAFGMDRTGKIVQRVTIVGKLVLMCLHCIFRQ